jgi:glycosyltransferase 2 family protein
VAGHVATLLVAARAVGVAAPTASLLPLALLVLLAGGLPVNVAGWGPREGAAAWLFGAAGIGTAEGVATAVAFGVMVLVANLPGALVLLAGSRTREAARADSPGSALAVAGQVTGHG